MKFAWKSPGSEMGYHNDRKIHNLVHGVEGVGGSSEGLKSQVVKRSISIYQFIDLFRILLQDLVNLILTGTFLSNSVSVVIMQSCKRASRRQRGSLFNPGLKPLYWTVPVLSVLFYHWET